MGLEKPVISGGSVVINNMSQYEKIGNASYKNSTDLAPALSSVKPAIIADSLTVDCIIQNNDIFVCNETPVVGMANVNGTYVQFIGYGTISKGHTFEVYRKK